MSNTVNIPQLRFPEFTGEWERKKLGEVSNWASGGTPPKDNPDYWNGNIPWISASSMRGTKYFDSELKISDEGLRKGSKLAKQGTLLILVRGSMLFSKIPIGIAMKDLAFNQDVKSIAVSKTSNPDYILQWFISSESKIMNMVTGTGIGAGKLDLDELKGLELIFPTLPEQTKIATFLTAVDEKIQALKKKHSLLEQYKKGVMQKLFSQELRFKDENGIEFPEWEEKQVKDLFKVTRGDVLAMSLVSDEVENEHIYPVYSSQTKNRGLAGYYNEYLFEDAITWTTDGAGAGDVNFREGKFYCTNVCGVLLSDEGYANLFIAELLNSVSRKYVSYVGNPKLMNNVMAEISIIIPVSVEEQQRISSFLKSLNVRIKQLESEISKIENWKKGLLQKMFV
jgi:type I restriction enzyme, S subunit